MIEGKVPNGWVFYTADFSLVNSKGFHNKKGRVVFKRDSEGTLWWSSLDEEQRKEVELFVTGRGCNLEEAFEDAAKTARISDEIAMEVVE